MYRYVDSGLNYYPKTVLPYGQGDVLVVSVLDFYSDDPSSNLAEEMKKRPLLAHLKSVLPRLGQT